LAAAAAAAPAASEEAVTTPGYYFREMSPWPTDVPIVEHDPAKDSYVDLVIAGAGPSGLAVGERVAKAGYRVCIIDPQPLGIWPNNYGVWVDEFEAMGLGDCLEVIWPKAKVFLDSDNLGEK
jgi:lycopene beta-cyclase